MVGEEYGNNDSTEDESKTSTESEKDYIDPDNQLVSVEDDQQKLDSPTVTTKFKHVNQIEEPSTDKYTPFGTGLTTRSSMVRRMNRVNKMRRDGPEVPVLVKINSLSVKNGSLLNHKQTTDSNIVKMQMSLSPSLQGEIKKTYCVWINGTQHCSNAIYKPDLGIQERSHFESSAKKRENKESTSGREGNILKNTSKFAVTFSDNNSSETGTKFKSSFINLPIFISIVRNKTHSEEQNTNEQVNSNSKDRSGKYFPGPRENNLIRNGSLYQFGTLYDDYKICDIGSTAPLVYQGKLCVYIYCIIMLLNVLCNKFKIG